jgi:hypothetical protein
MIFGIAPGNHSHFIYKAYKTGILDKPFLTIAPGLNNLVFGHLYEEYCEFSWVHFWPSLSQSGWVLQVGSFNFSIFGDLGRVKVRIC